METTRYLTEKQVSELTGFAIQTLRNGRNPAAPGQAGRIKYLKIGKSIRYSIADVLAYMESHKIDRA